ncbi:MAG: hypothetical protein KAS71_06830 [Bacteroidales bacterium]|nr:hypothetical protein [Bacteroidales bacterium]
MKKHKSKFHSGNQSQTIKKTCFLFYGEYNSAQLNLLKNSASRINRDLKSSTKIVVIQDKSESISTEDEIQDIEFVNQSNNLFPDFGNDYEGYFLFPLSRLNKEINFNDLLKENEFKFPADNSWSSVLFKDQDLHHSGVYAIGKELFCELKRNHSKKNLSFIKNLRWYLERYSIQTKKIILSQNYVFTRPTTADQKIHLGIQAILRWIKWNFSPDLSSFSNFLASPASSRFIFTILSVLIMVITPVISFNAGISGDEEKHHLHAEKVYNYFATGGEDTLALKDPKYKLNYYSQSFDLICYVGAKVFNIERVYELRHVLNGFTAAAAIVTTGVFVRFLAGNFAGILSLFFLFFSPRFLGHAMNNPLDIPFAFGYIFTIYQIFRFLRKLPLFSLKHAFWIFFGIAFTTSIRIGGMVLIPYFLMFSGLFIIFNKWPWKFLSGHYLKFAGKGLIYLVVISLAGFFTSLLIWPYALQDPIKNPFKALEMMSNITVALRVMFEGKIIWSDSLPWYYIIKNMAISIPAVIIFSFIISIVLFIKKIKRLSSLWLFMLLFATIFPVLYLIYKESNVYGGWRHLLFIYPSFVALSAISLEWIRQSLNKPIVKYVFSGLVFLAMIHPILHISRNYPLQYIYFNEIKGGVNNSYKKFETDYYLHSLKPGTDWVIENLADKAGDEKIRVISNAPAEIMKYYYRDHLDKISYPYTRYYDRGAYDWDYAIFYCNYINPYHLKKDIWPPKNTIHSINVDDVTVCAIVKRENTEDYEGINLAMKSMRERNFEGLIEGIEHMEAAIKYDKYNEISYLNLARAYITIQDFDRARERMNTLLGFYPEYDKALNLIGYSYLNEGDVKGNTLLIDKSIGIFSEVIRINYKYVEGYHNLGLAYMIKNDSKRAFDFFNKALNVNPNYKQSYIMIGKLYEKEGDSVRAKRYFDYANSL